MCYRHLILTSIKQLILKVLHIINSLHTGGAEKLIISTLPLLIQKGIQVDLLLLNGEETPFLKALEKESDICIKFLGKSFFNPLYIFRLMPYFKEYDLIHVHLFPSMYFVALAKLLSFSKTTILFTEHSTSNRRLQNRIFRPLERMIYSMYTAIVCISESVKITLQHKIGGSDDKYTVINNGIQVAQINQALAYDRPQFGFNDADKLICMVSAFRKEKDHETLIQTLEYLPKNYKLLLIGDGERLETVKQFASSLGVAKRVTFLGLRSDVYSLIKMCDIAVLSSHWEGFGLAAAEAMACGTPTIASNVNGLAQVVSGGGMLFEKGNTTELASKIVSLEDKDYYSNIQKRCIEKAKKYDLHNTVNHLLDLYKKLSKN